MFVRDGALGLF